MELKFLGLAALAGATASLIMASGSSLQPTLKASLALRRASAEPVAAVVDDPYFSKTLQPLLNKYCDSCHSGDSPPSGLSLAKYHTQADLLNDPEAWQKVVKRLQARTMPPSGLPKPTDAELVQTTAWIEGNLRFGGCGEVSQPGRVTMRRLNRAEYRNTIRDLMGVDFTETADFPSDDVGYGFDNIGDVLSLPPMLMEKYVSAAEKIVDEGAAHVVKRPPNPGESHEAYARFFLAPFATRAFRRPVTASELDRLVKLVQLAEKNGDGLQEGMKLALQAVIVSPYFLYRVERDPPGTSAHPISDYQLASRLSYFLWSSMPDAELLKLAKAGTLRQGDNLESQVRRMLLDVKAKKGLAENFGGQWLQIRRLKSSRPDPSDFPTFNENLRFAMYAETEMFFESIMRNDRSLLDFLDANYTFLNERLAKHYGIEGVKGPSFRRVALKGDERGGVLTQASILTFTSNPNRTSPVKRGKWILEQMLNDAPPPPPPGVAQLNEDKAVASAATLRERMEKHRADPKCASCHARMDPIGFAFENYDAIGKWRTRDGKFPIDTAGALPSGEKITGPTSLKSILLSRKKEFIHCLAEKMLTFALGRGLEPYDRCTVDALAGRVEKNNYKFSSLVLGIVDSDPFQKRSPEPPKTVTAKNEGGKA